MSKFRAGHVSIIGKPNVGKSTLLNQLINQKISIVTRKPQTTRWNINGIKTNNNYQIIFIDTPGLQISPKYTLNRYMNKEVSASLIFVDIIIFVVESLNWDELDYNVVRLLKRSDRSKLFLAINKIDKIPKKEMLLSEIDSISKRADFDEIIPISAIKGVGLDDLEKLVVKNLPISEPLYPINQITDRSERFFAAEFIREKLIMRLSDEVPYHTTVTIDEFRDNKDIIHIDACIWVEKEGQKPIVIGKDGKVLKEVGRLARIELETFFNKKVNLKTWVKIRNKWRDSKTVLKEFGY
ncbi:MAG: GTPase Era [Pseudomonadota bacterium]|nr:GTPase Era [Pseudomonadota bacterium]|tara:strand:- start:805 stop:1692 length:888 start_codon:yes stop_codon:yes gene_type:complete